MLRPPDGQAPEAIAHFLGGAFVGAAPQLSYKDFLEGIAEQRVLVSGVQLHRDRDREISIHTSFFLNHSMSPSY